MPRRCRRGANSDAYGQLIEEICSEAASPSAVRIRCRCAVFLRLENREKFPDHSWLSKTRGRLPRHPRDGLRLGVEAPRRARSGGSAKRVGIGASTIEANAALRTIVRRDDGRTYREMLTQIAKESGIETPSGPRRWLQSWHLMRLLIGPEPRERKLPVHWPVHSSSTLSGPQIVVLVATSYNGFARSGDGGRR